MIVYRFDGSFDGMLTAVFDSFVRKESPDLLLTPAMPMPLFYDTLHDVTADEAKSRRVWKKLTSVLSKGACSALTAAFLTDNGEFPLLALRFVSRAVTSERNIEGDFSDPAVVAVLKECRRVRGEAHRLLQFVRFQKAVDGTYFSMIEPLFDVLPFAVSHFADRFADQPFIIYDRIRDYGYHSDGDGLRRITLHDEGAYHLATGRLADELMAPDERLYQQLWRCYVKSIAIRERTNPRKQRQDMPVRFWKYLTEMQ
ncbi:MAG: TIGR03915 family putative DNA repair protein [Staphylococcus sp.]|nr:TIGR03915 family putative DNA repair protein [Staphylococcus sp.]